LTEEELKTAAGRAYPGFSAAEISRPQNQNQAVTVSLKDGVWHKDRLFNPYTGQDLGEAVPLGIRIVSKLLELHDDLLAGNTGRSINGLGGFLVVVLAATGMFVWWPGIKTWRRSLIVHRNVGWRRFTGGLHNMDGFLTVGFSAVF